VVPWSSARMYWAMFVSRVAEFLLWRQYKLR
jgi:hypothetical protein